MSQSIIHTTITNKTLRLELDYRPPSVFLDGDASTEGPTTDGRLGLQYYDSQISDEFLGY